jgi:cytochrome c oxidase subunit I
MSRGALVAPGLGAWRYGATFADERVVEFALPVPGDIRKRLAAGWLLLALAALVGSGLFSVLLVLARTPGVQRLFPLADFFHVALVVHVDLSVLVWFVAFAGMLWTLNSRPRFPALAAAALALAVIGAVIMAAAPFFGQGRPIMSNYVPVLDDSVFLFGLTVFGIGFALLIVRSLLVPTRIAIGLDGEGALRFGLNASVVAAAIACIALVWSWIEVPADLSGKPYYELLFWGGGHVIQFTWTLLMLVAWLWLATLIGAPPPLSPRLAVLLFAIALASVFVVPVIYLAWDIASIEHQRLHTWLMRFGGGLAILPVGLAVLIGLVRAAPGTAATRPLRAALISSLALFALGGLIGFMIRGSDVRIPAHYHGSIVGVTLALMGLAYALLPRLGFGTPQGRLATLQPTFYGGGQLVHIIGLVWSGGYGVQRKVAGSDQVLQSAQEVAGMGLMGLGGLVAVVGGVLFLIVVFRALLERRGIAPA